MNKIEEIFTSWRIALTVVKDDPEYDLACKRIEICNGCEHKEMIAIGEFDIFARCNLCGCALKAKIFTPKTYQDAGGTCPIQNWTQIESDYLNSKNNEKKI